MSRKNGKNIPCKRCQKTIYVKQSRLNKTGNFCSKDCSNKYHAPLNAKRMKGTTMSEETKDKLKAYTGKRASGWKGGKPFCPDCKKEINYKSKNCGKCKMKHRTKAHQTKLNKAISKAMVGRMPKNMGRAGVAYSNIKRGWFDINGKRMFFRSTWEANYALYLDTLKAGGVIKSWGYEKRTFIFKQVKSGVRSYLPDFKITNNDKTIEYHEVKGWMDSRSKVQLSRMKKYYPNVKLILIDKPVYLSVKKKLDHMVKVTY